MKSLFNICISYVSRNLDLIASADTLPVSVKELLLEWLVSHDFLVDGRVKQLLLEPKFGQNIHRISFYLTEELTDEMLICLGANNKRLRQVSLIHCARVTDTGVRGVTLGQESLVKLELRGLKHLSSFGIAAVESKFLTNVDLSDCHQLDSEGIVHLLTRNASIHALSLNYCKALDDVALYAIASYLGGRLRSLDLDFLTNIHDPVSAIANLTECCPNLQQLSLCRYFLLDSSLDLVQMDCEIHSGKLRELDFYGNYFAVLPILPNSITSLRLSCSGTENVEDLAFKLLSLPKLASLRLVLSARENSPQTLENVNDFLNYLLPRIGDRLTAMQLQTYKLTDETMRNVISHCDRLVQLSLDVQEINVSLLRQLFGAYPTRVAKLRTLKLSRLASTSRLLTLIARHCVHLEELEMSHMQSVDNRFLKAIALKCPKLRCVNFNGCRWVTDKGLCALARRCNLREVRVRATSVTDQCIYVLAQCCSDLEWVAHADYTGKPKFSTEALQILKDSCTQRVIC